MAQIILISGDDHAQVSSEAAKQAMTFAGTLEPSFELDVFSPGLEMDERQCLLATADSMSSAPFFGEKTVWLKAFDLPPKPKAELAEQLDVFCQALANVADGVNLLISGVGHGKVSALFKKLTQLGIEIKVFNKPLANASGERAMCQLIESYANELGFEIAGRTSKYIQSCLGNETSLIYVEIDKLASYCAGRKTITLDDAMMMVQGDRGASDWLLDNALQSKSLEQALKAVDVFLSRATLKGGEAALKIEVTKMMNRMSSCLRKILEAKILVHKLAPYNGRDLYSKLQGMPAEAKRDLKGFSVLRLPSYPMGNFEKAQLRYNPHGLIRSIELVDKAVRKVTFEQVQVRFVLENLLLQVCSDDLC